MKTYLGIVAPGRLVAVLVILGLMIWATGSVAEEITEEGTAAPESAEEQYELAMGYYKGGFGVPKNNAEAVKWYRKAVEHSIAKAQDHLVELYIEGIDELQYFAKEVMHEIMSELDLCLGPDRDYDEALKWFRKAADQGHVEAQYWVGYMYSYGIGMPENSAEALKWYRKAADQGHIEAQSRIGDMYCNGDGVPENTAEAVKWYRRAAKQGHVGSMNDLGYLYYYGFGDGVPKDKAEAVQWYSKAAEQGHAGAQYDLGEMYYKGDGVPKDNAEAAKWLRKAAKQGSYYAQYDLGMMWVAGDEGVPEDDAEAEKWYNETQ